MEHPGLPGTYVQQCVSRPTPRSDRPPIPSTPYHTQPLRFPIPPSQPPPPSRRLLQPPRRQQRQRPRQQGAVTCALTVLRERTLRRLLPAQFTGDQWKYYWGITESDKFGKIYEAASATFFGLWTSWFLTFLIGLPASTILGTVRA